MSIWRLKPVSAFEADMKKNDLKRVLTKWGLTSLGIGAIIGGGIFTLTGIAANEQAGPALALSFVIAGIGCMFAALCYAEFASVLPVEGSAYAYSYGTVGEIFAWFIGWNLILEYMMGATTVAVAWSGYFEKLLHLVHIKLPLFLSMDYNSAKELLHNSTAVTSIQEYLAALNIDYKSLKNATDILSIQNLPTTQDVVNSLASTPAKEMVESIAFNTDKQLVESTKFIPMLLEKARQSNFKEFSSNYTSVDLPIYTFNLFAFLITWLVTGILIKGIKEAANTNNIIVIVKIAVVLFVIIAGAFYINSENWTPFVPDQITDFKGNSHYGIKGIFTAASIVFFAYIGFDAVSTQAGEAINPKKDVPFAIIMSLVICTILYILVSLVLTGMVKYDQLDMRAPVASAFESAGNPVAKYLVVIAATAGLISVMLVMMLGQTRIFLGMAKDGLLPKFFKEVHPKFKTPHKSTILVGALISIVAALTPIEKVSEMCSMGTLLAFSMVCIAVMLLRYKKPELERPYKTPAVYVIGTLGALFNVALMFFVRKDTWFTFLIWGSLGIIVYFLYSRKNSNLNNKDVEEL